MAVMSLMSNEDFYERALTHSPEVAAAKAAQQVPTGSTRIGIGFDHEPRVPVISAEKLFSRTPIWLIT
jgi:hypothetical protein